MSVFIVNNHNSMSMKDAIMKSLDRLENVRLHRHDLWLMTCYLDFAAIKALIKEVKYKIKLKEVYLIFNYTEIYRSRRPNEASKNLQAISKWCKNQDPSINFDWRAIRPEKCSLMHAKAYSVIQWNKGDINAGSLFVGSANLTQQGMGYIKNEANGLANNMEIVYESSKKSDIQNFVNLYNQVWENYFVDLDKAIRKEDKYNFKYALLGSGIFLHKWTGTLNSEISLRYVLTEEGKEIIKIDPYVRDLGFHFDKGTLTKQPLSEYLSIPQYRVLPKKFASLYTIDTFINRWCPYSVWNIVEKIIDSDDSFKIFKDAFVKAVNEENLERAINESKNIENKLIEKNIIVRDDERLERWRNKIMDLSQDTEKLKRLFVNYEPFFLPYEPTQREEIIELYENLLTSINLMDSKNVIAKKVRQCIESQRLGALELDEDEARKLLKKLNDHSED